MSRFNSPVVKEEVRTKVTNLAGGEAYSLDAKSELVTIVLTSFLTDQSYRSGADTLTKMVELIYQVNDWEFIAKLALFARKEYGMRTVSHVLAAELAKNVKGQVWTKYFFNSIVYRPDDMTEIMAYYTGKYGKKPLPNCIKKGFAIKLEGLNEYSISKYAGKNKDYSLVDLVNLCHPKATEALTKLVNGTIKPAETWETKLTQAGQVAETEEEKLELKGKAWKELLGSGKLGYMAAIRNIRNIMKQAPELLNDLCNYLVDRERIKNSMIFPFTIANALKVLKDEIQVPQSLYDALNTACEISLENVPEFEGKTLICLDNSGSMQGGFGRTISPIDIASLFTAVIAKKNKNAEILVFNTKATFVGINKSDSLLTIQKILLNCPGGGTDFKPMFSLITKLNKVYDRIIILSDMQGWRDYDSPLEVYKDYKKVTGANPFIYSFDLVGYGTTQLPLSKVALLAGFSDKSLETMKFLEQNKNELIDRINKIIL